MAEPTDELDELFAPDYGDDESPEDQTIITTHLLYYSTTELERFKRLCKIVLRKRLGVEVAKEKGNISDLVMQLLEDAANDHVEA